MVDPTRAQKLRALVALLSEACETIVEEWEKEESPATKEMEEKHTGGRLPSWQLYNAQRVVIGACGAFTELVHNPQLRLLEVSTAYFESRALHIAAEHRIADIVGAADPNVGVPIHIISKTIGINEQKLSKRNQMFS